MTKAHWTTPAERDRAAIFDYIAENNPAAAERMDDRFIEAVSELSKHPQIGRVGRAADTREFVAHENYILVYTIRGDDIFILTLLHTSQLYPPTDS